MWRKEPDDLFQEIKSFIKVDIFIFLRLSFSLNVWYMAGEKKKKRADCKGLKNSWRASEVKKLDKECDLKRTRL